MSKRKSRKAMTTTTQPTAPQNVEAFTFGEPSPVMDKREILDHAAMANGTSRRSALTDWRAVCGPPYITVRRCL
ncbi:Uncharacterised protein [Serratia fonticola]|nr:Uncharacterised protein [Serratia fonticola]